MGDRRGSGVRFDLTGLVSDRLTDWRVEAGELWHTVEPSKPGGLPEQGWKLHLSATPTHAAEVLANILPVLEKHRVRFKFAPTVRTVRFLGSRECERAASGKFVTVYPSDPTQCVALAADLHAATAGLAGPRILSDRPYCPGSLVHYRYGGFTGASELDNDGVYSYRLAAPDGSTVPDRREAWYNPPNWAPCPFDSNLDATDGTAATAATAPRQQRRAVLLGGRYVVREALRHSTKGGIYAATDTGTDTPVVVKHARAYAEGDLDGSDARGRLLHEARMLRRLHTCAGAPRPLAVFAQAGDLFLVEERIAGTSLAQWVRQHAANQVGVPADEAISMARALLASVAAVHVEGVVLRDLSPTNILVDPDGTPRLIDLEAAGPIGLPARRTGTPGYRAPELRAALDPEQPDTVVADPAEDRYSLGALFFLLATGNDPVLPHDEPIERPLLDRLSAWLAEAARYGETARLLGPIAQGLLADRPEQRLELGEATRRLSMAGTGDPRTQCLVVGEPTTEELLHDGLDHLIGTMTPDGSRLWPSSAFGSTTDPRNVQHGAAGVLEVLVRAMVDGDPRAPGSGDLEATTRKAACWLGTRAERGGEPLPGMYFGRSGVAWALADASGALEEPHLLELATRLALRLPTEWPNPDIAHGLAGATLAHVRLGELTADGRLADRLRTCAEGLRRMAVAGPDGPLWPIPTDFASQLAGVCHYGFAHGVAGVGYALLAAGRALEEPAYVDLACDAGYLLCRVAHTDDNGAAWWPVGPNELTRLPHWCSGSSGVGTFLLRLLAVTGEQRFSEYARAAAGEVYQSRWRSSPASCHGLSGDGQFLLDAAEQLDDGTYRAWAEDLVRLMAVRHCRRSGRTLVPDESARDVVADYNVGLAGVLAYLLRLRYGGPRPFTVDDVIVEGWPERPRSAGWDRPW